MIAAYYNDTDPFVRDWLRNLMGAGLIMQGEVDDRSIEEVKANDLKGFTRCHFFAGIAGWELALQLAGWPADQHVWTGSCPCQPLSSAGLRQGHADRRHLWPAFYRLIAECRPPVVFGEQVASKDGREWFSAVRADLESVGYACGGADLPAASVGAPHIRQRLWLVADANGRDAKAKGVQRSGEYGQREKGRRVSDGLADSKSPTTRPRFDLRQGESNAETNGTLGNATLSNRTLRQSSQGSECQVETRGSGLWTNPTFIPCADGKARAVEPGILPLAHGIPGRVGRLRAYGNAIVPQVAAAFILSYMEDQ